MELAITAVRVEPCGHAMCAKCLEKAFTQSVQLKRLKCPYGQCPHVPKRVVEATDVRERVKAVIENGLAPEPVGGWADLRMEQASTMLPGPLDVFLGQMPLLLAAENGVVEEVYALLRREGIDANTADNDGQTALLLAAKKGHSEIVTALLGHEGIDANKANRFDETALHWAAEKGHVEIVTALLGHTGIDANKADSESGQTALHWAAENGNAEVVTALLKHAGIDADKADRYSPYGEPDDRLHRTPLHLAFQNDHIDVMTALLRHDGVDASKADSNGRTALHWAAEKGHAEIVTALLGRAGIDANETDRDGNTPLHLAFQSRDGETVLHWAAKEGHAEVVTALLGYTGIDVNKADRDGQTPLHLAVIGFIRIAGNPRYPIRSCGGETSYPGSITARLTGVLTALLGHAGIDVNKANNKHQTPLDLAARSSARDTELVEVASVLRRHSEQQGALIGRMLASGLMRSPRSSSALQDAVNAHPTLRTMQSQHPWFLPMLGALAEATLGGSAASDPLHSVQ